MSDVAQFDSIASCMVRSLLFLDDGPTPALPGGGAGFAMAVEVIHPTRYGGRFWEDLGVWERVCGLEKVGKNFGRVLVVMDWNWLSGSHGVIH